MSGHGCLNFSSVCGSAGTGPPFIGYRCVILSDSSFNVTCSRLLLTLPPALQTGKFVPEKSNIWRDCVDGYYDWVKEHIMEVRHKVVLETLRYHGEAWGKRGRG
jgi:hypothetical protein